MSQIQTFKRVIAEDFKSEDRELASKIGYSVNVFCEDLQNALNKNLSISDNLNINKKKITVTVDAMGVPIVQTSIKSDLSSNCDGIEVVRAINLDDPGTYPTTHPFISYTDNNGLLKINNITGLQANNKYSLTIILYPQN